MQLELAGNLSNIQIYKILWISDRFPLLVLDLEQLVRVEEKLRLKICLNIASLHYESN